MSEITDPANSSTLQLPGPPTVEDDFRQSLREYRLPSRPVQAPVLRSASRARSPGTSTGAEVALAPFNSLQQWVWECVWAATPVYDADTNTTLLEFYLTWINWDKTLDRERIESFGHANWSLKEFTQNIDPRCIRRDGRYKEGSMIYASTEGKRLMCLRAVESQLDLEGYWGRLARRHPANEAQFGVEWDDEDRIFQANIERFRLQLAARDEFDLLGAENFKFITDEQIKATAHDYSVNKRRRPWIHLELTPSVPATAAAAKILYDEIFGDQSYIQTLHTGYQRQRDTYLRQQAMMFFEPDEGRRITDSATLTSATLLEGQFVDNYEQPFNVDDLYEHSEPRIEFSAEDKWPLELKRLPGSELWLNRMEFLPHEKRAILQIVMSAFTPFAVRSASKKYRSPSDGNHICQMMNDDETRADCCTECWHWLNKAAVLEFWRHSQSIICPYCRTKLVYAPFPIEAISPAVRANRTKSRAGRKRKRSIAESPGHAADKHSTIHEGGDLRSSNAQK